MSEFDSLIDGELAEREQAGAGMTTSQPEGVGRISSDAKGPKAQLPSPRSANSREDAIELGQAIGELEAEARRETGPWREQRIRRAMMYAAWEYDGKPASRIADYRQEFGVDSPDLTASLDRAISPRLLKKK